MNGTLNMCSDEADVEESIKIIINTMPGERIMQPEFGCDLRKFVFEPISETFMSQLNNVIYNALLNYEPRIIYEKAEVTTQNDMEGTIFLNIFYSIIITNTRHNIVFPFYY